MFATEEMHEVEIKIIKLLKKKKLATEEICDGISDWSMSTVKRFIQKLRNDKKIYICQKREVTIKDFNVHTYENIYAIGDKDDVKRPVGRNNIERARDWRNKQKLTVKSKLKSSVDPVTFWVPRR